mgnify:CR=1 FL=1
MIVKLPTISKTWNEETNQVEVTKSEIAVDIDTSFKAHLKWEEQFQSTVGYSLSTYTDMVSEWIKDPNNAKARLVGYIKLLYCYINSDKLPTFKDFAGLFDFEVADEISNKIKIVLEEVGKTASKN